MANEELEREHKPCPFCGGEGDVYEDSGVNAGYHFVMCGGCMTKTVHFVTEDEAWEAWDRRTEEKP